MPKNATFMETDIRRVIQALAPSTNVRNVYDGQLHLEIQLEGTMPAEEQTALAMLIQEELKDELPVISGIQKDVKVIAIIA